jgi:hypothetical protein
VKNSNETISSCWRPNTWLIDAITGWNIAEVRRYEVPAQKASTDVPLSLRAISWNRNQHAAFSNSKSLD